MLIIAIDPGISGGIAWIENNNVQAIKMPESPMDIYERLSSIKNDQTYCILERVGGYVSGNSATAAVKFARHFGNLEMALLALQIPTETVAPTVWMKNVCGSLPKEKKDRKNKIKEIMQQMYPYLKITLSTADALGLLTYGKNYANRS